MLLNDKRIPKYTLEQIRQAYLDGEKQEYYMFWGHQPSLDGSITRSCLSQWWKTKFSCGVEEYCCMEQFMMAKKAELFQDNKILKQILDCDDPKRIKALGRKVSNFDEEIWNREKYFIVLHGNYMKFSQNSELKKFLLSTGDTILVEASPYDAIWGIKMSRNDKDILNPLKWKGKNLLGFALMEVRDELRNIEVQKEKIK